MAAVSLLAAPKAKKAKKAKTAGFYVLETARVDSNISLLLEKI